MPTVFSHPAVPLALGLGLGRTEVPARLLVAGAVLSVLPDLDVIAFAFGVPYAAPLGHRGFSHSLVFSAAVAWFVSLGLRSPGLPRARAFIFLFVSGASHGLLDAFTDGGLGIAFLWPFSAERFFAPVRTIEVSPIGLSNFLSSRGAEVLASELLWVWLPALLLGLMLRVVRLRRLRRRQVKAPPLDPL